MKNILSKTVLALGITAMVMAGCTENGTSEKQYVYLRCSMYFPERWQRTFYYYGRNLSGGVDGYARCLVGNRREIGK